MIQWIAAINSIKDKTGHVVNYDTFQNNTNPEYAKIYKLLTDSKVNLSAAEWINYYPGKDFDQSIVDEFAKIVGLTTLRAWISKVRPGKFVPYHWDVDENEEEYLKLGTIRRFTCFMVESVPGQVIMIESEYLYNKPAGTIYEWPDYKAWHASINGSLVPKYLFHFLGY